MSGNDNHPPEGTPVDPPTNIVDDGACARALDRANSDRVTTPIDVTDLSNTLSKALIEDQQHCAE